MITDAQSAAQVDVVEGDTGLCQGIGEIEDFPGGLQSRRRVEQLGADMAVDAADVQVRQAGCLPVQRQSLCMRYTEFVVLQPGRDVGMGFGIDIGVEMGAL